MNDLTIVTVTKNNLAGLRETAASLAGISGFQWLIKDGGSTDGSLEFLNSLEVEHQVIPLADSGIFDAMNIALALVERKYVLFLNAGDRLASSSELAECLFALANSQAKWICAGAMISSNSTPIGYWETPTFPAFWRWIGIQSWCHQATIYQTDFLRQSDGFDSNNILADWSTALTLELREKPLIRVAPLSIFELGGVSGSIKFRKWIGLHTTGRKSAHCLFMNSYIFDLFLISIPSYMAVTKPYTKRFVVPLIRSYAVRFLRTKSNLAATFI